MIYFDAARIAQKRPRNYTHPQLLLKNRLNTLALQHTLAVKTQTKCWTSLQ